MNDHDWMIISNGTLCPVNVQNVTYEYSDQRVKGKCVEMFLTEVVLYWDSCN